MAKRVLVADDDPTILRLVTMLLEMEGFEVHAATNGKEAVEQVAATNPDLLVCDVMMPLLNGLEVVARLRRDEATQDLPIVMLSAKAQEIDIQHGKGAGADEYVTKPFDPDTLVATIQRVLAAAPKAKKGGRAKGAGSSTGKPAGGRKSTK